MIRNQTFQWGQYLLNSEESTLLENGDRQGNKKIPCPHGALILVDDSEQYAPK